MCFRILSRAFSGFVTFHDRHNMAKGGGITVANHTSPIVSIRLIRYFLPHLNIKLLIKYNNIVND